MNQIFSVTISKNDEPILLSEALKIAASTGVLSVPEGAICLSFPGGKIESKKEGR